MIALALAAAAWAGPRVDRVDLLSESGAPFLVDDLPRYGTSPDVVTVRWIEQVALVGGLDRFTLSLSLAAQTLAWEPTFGPTVRVAGGAGARPLATSARGRQLRGTGPASRPLSATLGLRTSALLPDGAVAGLAVRGGPVRVGASVLLLSDATWSRPEWSHFAVLPALGLGLGPAPRPRAVWME